MLKPSICVSTMSTSFVTRLTPTFSNSSLLRTFARDQTSQSHRQGKPRPNEPGERPQRTARPRARPLHPSLPQHSPHSPSPKALQRHSAASVRLVDRPQSRDVRRLLIRMRCRCRLETEPALPPRPRYDSPTHRRAHRGHRRPSPRTSSEALDLMRASLNHQPNSVSTAATDSNAANVIWYSPHAVTSNRAVSGSSENETSAPESSFELMRSTTSSSKLHLGSSGKSLSVNVEADHTGRLASHQRSCGDPNDQHP